MTDKENNSNIQPPADTAAAQAPAPVIAMPPKISKGEKFYNWAVYSGLNYWLNLAMSLVIADFFTHGKGRPWLVKSAEFVGKNNPKNVHSIKVGLEQTALNTGGLILLAPIKFLEDRKRRVVHWLNKKMGVQQLDADGNELGPEEIYLEKEQPHQSWLRILGRRALAMSANIVPGMILDRGFAIKRDRPVMLDGKESLTIGGKERFTNFVVQKANSALNSNFIPGGKKLTREGHWVQRYLSLAVLDAINTKITATVMHVTNGAKHAAKPHEIDKEPPDSPIMKPAAGKADLMRFQSKKIAPKENFTAMAKKNEPDLSLAP